MSASLPVRADMALHRAIAERARAAFDGELASLRYAHPAVDAGVLDHELRLALYRIAHQGTERLETERADTDLELDVSEFAAEAEDGDNYGCDGGGGW